MSTWWTVVPSPVDDLLLATDGEALTRVAFHPHDALHAARDGGWHHDDSHPVLVTAARHLGELLAGERRTVDVPLAPHGTAFQRRVWDALLTIPYGTTTTYGALAERLGLPPGGSRAVGLANGANPLPVVIPCHRVVGADGTLTGFGGGLERKRFLLDLESRGSTLF
ncbi:methylated-DNA--[protein]-cysteine S-methyltransferase [Thalassiella azotivora]